MDQARKSLKKISPRPHSSESIRGEGFRYFGKEIIE